MMMKKSAQKSKTWVVSVAEDPFFGAVPETVPLPHTPLTGVLAQIRFPEILSISKADFVAEFQEKIRQSYPNNQQEKGILLQITPDGPRQTTAPHWRFFDESMEWRISLTTNFIAIETRKYTLREEFVERVENIAQALSETIKPSLISRIGVRYIDRIQGDVFENIEAYVRKEMLGVFTKEFRENIARSMNDLQARTDAGNMSVRSGYMPKNQTHEPDLMPAISEPSWFLDTDVFTEFSRSEKFVPAAIAGDVKAKADRCYAFFRWVVNDEFLTAYGGEL